MMTNAGRPSTEISASTHGRPCPSPVLTTQPMAESLPTCFASHSSNVVFERAESNSDAGVCLMMEINLAASSSLWLPARTQLFVKVLERKRERTTMRPIPMASREPPECQPQVIFGWAHLDGDY